jgi:hypothetical protein
MVSVRASVEPLHRAVGGDRVIFVVASFVGLPLINQALAAANPLPGGAFFVTVRTLIKVIETTPIDDVLEAIAQAHPPAPSPPPSPPPPLPPVKPTIAVSSSGSGQSSVFVVSGSGFSPNRDVRIRVVDDAFPPHERDFNQSADGAGKLNARLGIPCNSGQGLHFSATDGRPDPSDLTGVLFSNTFNTSCP